MACVLRTRKFVEKHRTYLFVEYSGEHEDTISILKSEHGKALKCYERALLFSVKPAEDDGLLYEFERIKVNFIPAINQLYVASFKALIERHTKVREDFDSLHEVLEGIGPEPDRSSEAMQATVKHVGQKFLPVVRPRVATEKRRSPLDELQRVWKGFK